MTDPSAPRAAQDAPASADENASEHYLRPHYSPGVPAVIAPVTEPLSMMLSDSARRFPERVALDFMGATTTYRVLEHRVDKAAEALRRLGVKPGDSVCMLLRNDIAFVESAYAAMRLGAYGVPINWHFKPEEIEYILKDTGTRVLIGHADMLHQLRGVIPSGVTVLSVPTIAVVVALLPHLTG